MATLAETLVRAQQYHQSGQLHDAEAAYRQIVQVDPNHVDAWCYLGIVYMGLGRFDEAIACTRQALALRPDFAEAHNNLSVAFRIMGRREEAIASLRQALRLKPDSAPAHNNLGLELTDLGKPAEAEAHFREAVRLRPDFAEAYQNLANILLDRGEFDQAAASFSQMIQLRPNSLEARNGLARVLREQGKLDEAIAQCRKVLQLQPNYAEAYASLAVLLKDQGKIDEAVTNYQQALRLKPDFAKAYIDLGHVFQEQGRVWEAALQFRQALRLTPDNGLHIALATMLPVIYDSISHLQTARQAFIDNIHRLHHEQITLDLTSKLASIPFRLAYQGFNDRDIQQSLARLYVPPGGGSNEESRMNGSTTYYSPLTTHHSLLTTHHSPQSKIKVGFISAFFKAHTIGRLMQGLIAKLSRADFAVSVLSIGDHRDALAQSIRQNADRFVLVPSDLPAARRIIAQQQLDILFYTDIGMDPVTYTLAFSRLAPVQCVTWGHPSTTGIGTMDYFISSAWIESSEAEGHYTEKLVRLQTLPTYYYRPKLSGPLRGRQHFNLEEADHVYACPQTLFKIHPEFDALLAGILRADPSGVLVLVRADHPHWEELLLKRFSITMPDVVQRIRLVPRQDHGGFLSLLGVADVLLDPIHFGGGNTSLEGLAQGVPVVTLPSPFMRARCTLGMYRRMQVMDCVAATPQEYIDIAVKLGTDPHHRADIRSKILAANSVLYEDMEAVRELERFFKKACNR